MFWKLMSEDNTTSQETYYMDAVSQLCLSHLLSGMNYGKPYANGSDLIAALEEIQPLFNETYFYCKWRNLNSFCDRFHTTLTEEGLCYSFNAFGPKDIYRDEALVDDVLFKGENKEVVQWNLEDGYSVEAGHDAYPYRVLGVGARAGLFLVLKGVQQDIDMLCRGPVEVSKVLLHTPGEVPNVAQQYFRIPFDQEVLISIKPKIITTSDGLRLRNADTAVCGAAKLDCIEEAQDTLLLKEFKQGLKMSAENFRSVTECNCLPACTSIAYEAEISQADYVYAYLFRSFKEESYLKDNPGMRMSRLSIFFKEAQLLISKRPEFYATTNFVAYMGSV